jgi:2-iminoacetate synthase
MRFGVSQIDGGTKIELGAYTEKKDNYQSLHKEQFRINDDRSLGEVIEELLDEDYLPSFCTACYSWEDRRTFMEFSVPVLLSDSAVRTLC